MKSNQTNSANSLCKKKQDQEVKMKFMCLVSKIEIVKIHLDF